MCWDPGRHGEGPLPQTLLWTLPLCPFYLFWRFLPVKPQLTCCLCGPCVCFCPHMTLSSFLGHSHAPSFVSLLQCYKKCCTGHLGPLLSFLRGFCLVPSNASTGHVLTDRQTDRDLFVGGNRMEDRAHSVSPATPSLSYRTSLSGLVGLFCHYTGQVLDTGARNVHLVGGASC